MALPVNCIATSVLHGTISHASQHLPDVNLCRSFTRPSAALAVIEGLGTRLHPSMLEYLGMRPRAETTLNIKLKQHCKPGGLSLIDLSFLSSPSHHQINFYCSPPLAQWLAIMASNAPASLLFLSTRSSSAGVSVVKELTAITTGTPNMCTFSMCFCRLANPASNRVRFSCGGERDRVGRGGKERK